MLNNLLSLFKKTSLISVILVRINPYVRKFPFSVAGFIYSEKAAKEKMFGD